jgi:integrase
VRRDEVTPKLVPLTREEAARFLTAARTHFPRAYPLFLCALRTGLRLGELLGLCDRCGGPRRILGAVTEPHAVRRLLAALGLAAEPPPAPVLPAA